ncbi:DUF2147 domain-containing protein [Sphingobium ummariense]|uniref:DUF2147 domain-containing protein n=1 Tax=Sphingobium ummariense RL-3 TaxID=1346791 RepID=T0KHQ7_9SPHN|nr:DUF2147 domain-containing protein [Sphingobium ummariense]EQB32858.1 hypothetical protein M529_07410 [Sphingobium ummariense RL-3]
MAGNPVGRTVSIALALLCVGAAPRTGPSFGIWSNPKGSVHVRAEPCGRNMCGVVVWASDKAKADAARGGTDPLVGTTLFRDFTPAGRNRWRGKVFVPDIGKTFSGTVTLLDPDRLEGEGCLLGGIGCKSQIWTRVTP